MLYIDSKYIGLVSARLEKFKRTKDHLYTFRCPYCGDSKKSKNKTRGYLFQNKGNFIFKCHNCGMSKGFSSFLKDTDTVLHSQYTMERYKEGLTGKHRNVADPVFTFEKPVFKKKLDLPLASTNARASSYLKKRKLDPTKFYYADRFKHYCNTVKPTFETTKNDHSRVVIPFYSRENSLIGFQGRSLDSHVIPKYLTVMLDENSPKVYGLEKVNTDEEIYRYIFVYDNEPRSREIVAKITKTIEESHKVVIFPSHIREKDINDMVLAGHDIKTLLESNTYSGLKAKLKLQTWKRV